MAYAIQQIEDAVVLDDTLTPAKEQDCVEGIVLHEGETITLLDSYAIFAKYGRVAKSKTSLTCQLPDSDWADAILAPLVARCGYTIVSASHDQKPDVHIIMAGDAAKDQPTAGGVIVIQDTPEDGAVHENSVYRYDENALVEALRDARVQALRAAATGKNEEAA